MSSILGAALTPFVAAWLARQYGPGAVGFYLVFLCALSFIALTLCRESTHTDLAAMSDERAVTGIESTSP
jgi:fucose permease